MVDKEREKTGKLEGFAYFTGHSDENSAWLSYLVW